MIYSTLPDIDSDISIINKWVTTGILILIFVSIFRNWKIIIVACVLFLLFIEWAEHRGFIHSIIAGLIFSAPIILLWGVQYSALAFACYFGHLASEGELSLR